MFFNGFYQVAGFIFIDQSQVIILRIVDIQRVIEVGALIKSRKEVEIGSLKGLKCADIITLAGKEISIVEP